MLFTLPHPDFWLHRVYVRLVLILLYLAGYLRHFSPLEKIDQLSSVGQEVGISHLNVQDVGQVHAQEGYAGGIDAAQLLLVLLEVVVGPALFQSFLLLLTEGLSEEVQLELVTIQYIESLILEDPVYLRFYTKYNILNKYVEIKNFFSFPDFTEDP